MHRVRVVVRPHWMNGWFMRLFATPYVVVDGQERAVRFNREAEFSTEKPVAAVAAGIRYARRGALLGDVEERVELRGGPGEVTRIEFRNGVFNHDPFVARRVG